MNTDMHDIMKFSKEFLFHPAAVSSIVPSSKMLSSKITNMANLKDAKVVFEFGCGSGAITRDIVSNLSDGAVFIAFDTNQTFTEIVKRKYPGVIVINDFAENVEKYMKQYSIDKVDVIISSLPWAAFSHVAQSRLLRIIYRILNPGGSFLTYIYLHTFVFPSQNRFRKILSRKFKTIDVSNAIWANLPPAAIIKCTR